MTEIALRDGEKGNHGRRSRMRLAFLVVCVVALILIASSIGDFETSRMLPTQFMRAVVGICDNITRHNAEIVLPVGWV